MGGLHLTHLCERWWNDNCHVFIVVQFCKGSYVVAQYICMYVSLSCNIFLSFDLCIWRWFWRHSDRGTNKLEVTHDKDLKYILVYILKKKKDEVVLQNVKARAWMASSWSEYLCGNGILIVRDCRCLRLDIRPKWCKVNRDL